jgi:hypothetical protein
VAHGSATARDMTNHHSRDRASFCIWIRDESGVVLFRLPFSDVSERIAMLSPDVRVLLQRWFELRRDVVEAMLDARKTVRQSRALVARAQGRPYLASEDGRPVL